MNTEHDAHGVAAADAAADEAELWAELIEAEPDGWDDVPPLEAVVVGFFDPAADLDKRAEQWSHALPDHRLGSLAAFAAGLAVAEAEAWRADEPHVATKAYADRRFLAADRIIHWAVPWLDAVVIGRPDLGDDAASHREVLLELGDRLRLAPQLTGSEGIVPEGHDGFGPIEPPDTIGTVRTGAVLLAHQRRDDAATLATVHEAAASRWRGLAWLHSGTALLWNDLAARAEATAARLKAQ